MRLKHLQLQTENNLVFIRKNWNQIQFPVGQTIKQTHVKEMARKTQNMCQQVQMK